MSDSNGRTQNTEKILLWGLVFCHYNGRTVVNPVLSSFYQPPFSSLSIAFVGLPGGLEATDYVSALPLGNRRRTKQTSQKMQGTYFYFYLQPSSETTHSVLLLRAHLGSCVVHGYSCSSPKKIT